MIVYILFALLGIAVGYIIGQVINQSQVTQEYKKSNKLLIDAMQDLNNLIVKLRRDLNKSHSINAFLQSEIEGLNTIIKNVRIDNGEIVSKQEIKDP